MILPRVIMSNKPNNCKYPYCDRCIYDDCVYDDVTFSDILRQDKFDQLLEVIESKKLKKKETMKRNNTREKGKERQKKYNNSSKGKEARKRYEKSEKGKNTAKRKSEKKIASGKNAEYCRAYYYRKKQMYQA